MIQTVTAWADMVIDIWVERMAQLNVDNAYFHAESFVHTIYSNANGDVSKIEFVFNYFLKFTDMGVGKGVKIEDRFSGNNTRIQKPWLTRTFLLEVRKLANMLAKDFAHRGTLLIVENTEDNAKKWTPYKI